MISLLFIGITISTLVLFYYATGKEKRVLVSSVLWILLVGAIAYSGYFSNTSTKPPRFLFVQIGALALSVFLFKTVEKNQIKAKGIFAIHAMRLPVEWGLYQLYLQKQIPIFMTFKGWNFDIVMGISAIIIWLYMMMTKNKLSRAFVLVWNVMGLVFLTTIVVIAILSSPLPLQQFAFDQPNIAVLKFPFIYLPAFIVPLVYIAHILAIKASRAD